MTTALILEPLRAIKITIDDQPFDVRDPVQTGRQLLDLAGKRPASDYAVLQFLPDGLLKEVELGETTDLRGSGVTRLITFQTDRLFRFTLDEREFIWGETLISGATLKKLAGVENTAYDVWQEMHKADDRKIGDNEKANLGEKGVERFFTAKRTTTEG